MEMNGVRNEILELASKLSEGDYLKIANVLKEVAEPTEKHIYRVKYIKVSLDYHSEEATSMIKTHIKTKVMELDNELYEFMNKHKCMAYRSSLNNKIEKGRFDILKDLEARIRIVHQDPDDENNDIEINETLYCGYEQTILSMEKLM